MTGISETLGARFRTLVVALENARSRNVPTYAPRAFGHALAHHERARRRAADLEPADAINREIECALEALESAAAAAAGSEPLLSQLVGTRGEIRRNEQVRYRAPKQLEQTERIYRQAVELAEQGKLEAAGKLVATAEHQYRDARLGALAGGLIGDLESRVQEAEDVLEPEDREQALAAVASLRGDLARARAGHLKEHQLTARIAAAGSRVGSLLHLNTGFGTGLDLAPPGGVFDIGSPGWAPGTFGPPTAPLTMRITDRTADTISLIWRNIPSNADSNIVERREDDGPWQPVATLPVEGEWQSHTDSVGLMPDRLYCYRITARNSFGSDVTPDGKRACGYTRDGNNLTLGRVQLRIRVADIANAGSNNAVQVRLSSPLATYSPSGNHTWLDYGPDYSFSGATLQISDDFDRGRDFTYDLNVAFLGELSDITMISIKKEGSDGLAIAELGLIVNGVLVFDRFFGETSSTALWIDGNGPIFTIFHPELRAHPDWPTSFPTPALQIPNQELVDRLEGIIGDQIHGTDLKWGQRNGSDWVEITRVDASTLHATLDLVYDIPGPNLEVDIEFDINVAIVCGQATATLMLSTSNVRSNVSFSILHDILSIGIVEFFDDNIERAIDAAWRPISQSFDLGTGGLCPVVEVDEDANLNFRLG